MKLTIEPTSVIVEINGVPARRWIGRLESGHEVAVYAVAVGSDDPAVQELLARELLEIPPALSPREVLHFLFGDSGMAPADRSRDN